MNILNANLTQIAKGLKKKVVINRMFNNGNDDDVDDDGDELFLWYR